ncbi:MAG: PEP/pyruvate-binding domain-containing protein, partial [Ilumatobacter sp.]|uniref:PEP/pyruvate-binding domain-containing protein n=1 Tax=Ilumatobacter sp. TaxID=1967498 RepID=UPI003C737EBD
MPTTMVGSSVPSTDVPTAGDPLLIDPDSHTVGELRSVADFEQVARDGIAGQSVVKFSITEFSADPRIEWLDSGFYTLHDEWYWFQLLNGSTVRGFDTTPADVDGAPFDTIAEVYDWADSRRAALPLDLRFTSLDRLYSQKFYDEAVDASPSRSIGLGSLIRSPDRDGGPDRWLIELEFSDEATAAQIATFFDVVGESVPDDIADGLFWVPRSRSQEQIAAEIEAGGGEHRAQIVRYDELAEPGDVQVYSPAIAAGRILVVTDGGRWSLGDAGPDDIVAIDRAPDDLPPGNGLITGTPQTPLAHVNVLALNRGIPNAYLAGLADDTTIAQLGRVRAKVLVRTTAAGELEIIPLTDEEYDGWRATQRREEISVEPVDLAALEYTETLAGLVADMPTTSDLDELRREIGGKAAGFVELSITGTTTMPTDPMAITVRPYVEHMMQFDDVVDALLTDSDLDSPRLRHLVLEGREAFDERYDTERDATLADEFAADHRAGSPIGDALAADGFVELIRSSRIEPGTLTRLSLAVSTNFADLDPSQGLRFRSSSTVEDIEGFNGAGIYDSNTGYLDPTVLPDTDDHERTVERAILRTWSSYWSATAFEERDRENVDHRSGSMAVLVHPRFDDDLEIDNGVATFAINPNAATALEMVVNVQLGDTSVTNDDNEDGLLPEIVRVVLDAESRTPSIERVATSSLADGDAVLDDEDLLALFERLRSV